MNSFSVTFFNDEEIMASHYPQERTPIWHKQAIGTWLLNILNCDIDDLEAAVAAHRPVYPGDFATDSGGVEFLPPSADAYNSLVREYPFLDAYNRGNWTGAFMEICPIEDSRTIRDVITDTKDLIQIISEKPEYMNYDFLSRYLLDGVIESDLYFDLSIYESDFPLTVDDLENISNASLVDRLEYAYKEFQAKKVSFPLKYKYKIEMHRIEGIIYSTLFELVRRNKIVRKCKICGMYFIPENRSDTLYCSNACPQNSSMTCKEYGSQRLWYERQKDDELATLSRNILSAKSMFAKRNPDIVEYKLSYDYFRTERIRWKKAVENNLESREEYRKWLLSMRDQKIIKEALNGTHREEQA